MTIEGFWSYVHADDTAEGGRISALGRDVVAQYELLTADQIRVFLDQDSLEWGDEWQRTINGSLASIAFFIPVLTPRFFLSEQCRRELNVFVRRAQEVGAGDLLLPILYVDVPGLYEDHPVDELMVLIKSLQWEDWRTLRFEDPGSSLYRRAVAGLAERLVRANRLVESSGGARRIDEELEEDDGPGILERYQAALEGMDGLSRTLSRAGQLVEQIGDLIGQSAEEITNSPRGNEFPVRLRIVRDLAEKISAPIEEVGQLGKIYSSQLYDIDAGIRLVIEEAQQEISQGEVELSTICEFFASLKQLAKSADESLTATERMVGTLDGIEQLSRDIRPVIRAYRKALTVLVEGRPIILEWVDLMDDSGIECAGVDH